jgi:hypothetical protein
MHTNSRKQAIRNAFFRLGLHATPPAVVQALLRQGIRVSEELVRQVRIELLKETTMERTAEVPRPVPSPGVRRCPKGFPGRSRG